MFGIREIVIAFALVWTVNAFAGISADRFVWERSGRFFLSVSVDGMRAELRGNVRLGETGDARQGPISAQVKSYATGQGMSPVISAIITNDGTDDAFLILIQADGEGDTKKILTPGAIPGRKATAARDLEFILSALKDRKNWDALASFNWLASTSSGKQLFQIATTVETAREADLALPRPQPRVAEGQGQTVRTPDIPPTARGMDPSVLDNPQQQTQVARGRGRAPDDDSMFSDDPNAPQMGGQPRGRPRQPQYGDPYGGRYAQPQYGDQYGYPPPPPEVQGRGYPQQPRGYPQYPQQQQGQRYQQQRGYAGNGYPPPPPQGGFFNGNGGGFFERLFQN